MADTWQVSLFLRQFKQCWPPNCFVVPREKNNEALARLGLTPTQRRDEILALTEANYCAGPSEDHDYPGQNIWVFGTQVARVEIYVKLTLAIVRNQAVARCLSFHEADEPLSYPCR